MRIADPIAHTPWRAELMLDYERRDARTVLARRRHDGPLVVQKPLYPEGDEWCHTIVVHPPAGIAGGDELVLSANLGEAAGVLLTTPGAGKWYRSAGPWARQQISFDVAHGAALEWLPQETIIFDGALADLRTDVYLKGDACYAGWDVLCLGRTGSGERFLSGEYRARTSIWRDGRPQWIERARLTGDDTALTSAVALAGKPVAGTFVITATTLEKGILGACRELQPVAGDAAVTLMPGLFVARYLGSSSEAAKKYFTSLWSLLRPLVNRRAAQTPRIWRT